MCSQMVQLVVLDSSIWYQLLGQMKKGSVEEFEQDLIELVKVVGLHLKSVAGTGWGIEQEHVGEFE